MNNKIEGSYTRYLLAVLENSKVIVDELQEKTERSELEEAIGNTLLNRPGPRYANTKVSHQEQFFFGRVRKGFNEIYYSCNALADIAIYVRRSPYSELQISKTRYLHYHVSNYLNEVYILTERLKTYAKTIVRAYGRGKKISEPEKTLQILLDIINPLNGIVSVRGSHVHGTRYTDHDFDRLELLELLSQADEPSISKALYPYVLRETKKKWRTTISENQKSIQGILDMYFCVLYPFVFDDQGGIVIPSQSRKSNE